MDDLMITGNLLQLENYSTNDPQQIHPFQEHQF